MVGVSGFRRFDQGDDDHPGRHSGFVGGRSRRFRRILTAQPEACRLAGRAWFTGVEPPEVRIQPGADLGPGAIWLAERWRWLLHGGGVMDSSGDSAPSGEWPALSPPDLVMWPTVQGTEVGTSTDSDRLLWRKGVSTEFGAVFRPTGGESAPTREIGVPARVEEIMIAVAGLVEDPGRFLSGGRTEYFDPVFSTARDSGQWSGGGGSAGRAGSAGNGGSAGRAGGRWSSA